MPVFAIRDELWKRTNGQMYLDYKPFSMLGGEVEVLNQLQMGRDSGDECQFSGLNQSGDRVLG